MVSKYLKSDVFVFLLFLLTAIVSSSFLMYEFKWDFTNYHYYNPWAFLNGRLDIDISPASFNTYYNPLIDLPFYFLVQNFNDYPCFVSALQGSYFGILLFVFYKICILYFPNKDCLGRLQVILALIIGATGFATFMQMGTTTNEIQVSILVLWALYLLIKEIFIIKSGQKKIFLWSGIILGVSLGLKPTTIIYCLGSGFSLIIFCKEIKMPLIKIFLFCLGGLVGYLLINGFWMITLWEHFKNPFFPFLNKVFQSEYFDNLNYSDRRFLPSNWQQFLFYPFFWPSFDKGYVSEVFFWDFRLALLEIIAFVWLIQFFRGKTNTTKEKRFLFVFVMVSYFIWLCCFSIIRYLIPIEMLTAIIIVMFFTSVRCRQGLSEIVFYSFSLIVLFVLLTTPYHSSSLGSRLNDKKVIDVEPLEIKEGTLILVYNMPSAAIATYWGQKVKNLRFLGTNQVNVVKQEGSDFADRHKYKEIKDKIIADTAPENIMALVRLWCSKECLNKIYNDKRLQQMYCRKLENNLDDLLYICRYQKWYDEERKGLNHV